MRGGSRVSKSSSLAVRVRSPLLNLRLKNTVIWPMGSKFHLGPRAI
jgi:hypothetical protein